MDAKWAMQTPGIRPLQLTNQHMGGTSLCIAASLSIADSGME